MSNESFEECCDRTIRLFKEIKLKGWTAEELRKLVIRNLQAVKRKGLNCLKKSHEIEDVEV